MEGFFLPSGEQTKLMPGDQIVFTQNGNGPEIINFYRREERIFLNPPPNYSVGGENEYPRRLLHTERLKIAKLLAAATGTKLRTLEWGERRMIFQFI